MPDYATQPAAKTAIDELDQRGLLDAATPGLREHLAGGARSFYCGFDPTAPSLQLGNIVPILALRRLQIMGHRPILVVGGATGLIGDPSGKAAERPLANPEEVADRAARIEAQMRRFLDFDAGAHAAILVNNADWLSKINVIDFVHAVGKRLSAKRIAGMDSVRNRWDRDEDGISFAEFAYTAFQAYDFVHLRRTYGCTVQVGGKDQWGNITIGTELMRKTLGERGYGLTFPLILDANGNKLGKSEAGRIWLDPALTSPFALHQYFVQASDKDAINWLPRFTFLQDEEIVALLAHHQSQPEQRQAQFALADAVTAFVHGPAAVTEARRQADVLFGGSKAPAEAADLASLSREPGIGFQFERNEPLPELLVSWGLAQSRREARQFLADRAIYWNGEQVQDAGTPVTERPRLHERYAIVRRGKRLVRLIAF